MNELSMIFDRMNINTYEVLEAAGTKWNFLKFNPGLVGGHCIGVDPYYLTYKAKELGFDPKIILSGRYTNDVMSAYVAKKAVQMLAKRGKEISKCKVLVLGATFKENVEDIRNSKVADLVRELKDYSLNVTLVDPKASPEEFMHEYNLALSTKIASGYDAIILAVSHNEYKSFNESYFKEISSSDGIFLDLKGLYRGKIKTLEYWSL
jgi:UDP-N-acetyl-D-galactosamine dehydrogenase